MTGRGHGGQEGNEMKMTVQPDRWSIIVDDAQVHRIAFDWAVTLAIGPSNGPEFDLQIEQPCILLDPKGNKTVLIPAGDPSSLAPLLALVHRRALRADAFKDGHFELQLAGDYLLNIPSTGDYEPWQIVATDGARLVSVPGGDVAIWESASTRR
jgi:hypothetical protein